MSAAAVICSGLALIVSVINLTLVLHVIARQNETPTVWPGEWLGDTEPETDGKS